MDNTAFEKQLNANWNWLCEDIEDPKLKFNTMMVLENSFKHLVKDGQLSSDWLEKNILNEDVELNEAPAVNTYGTFNTSQVIPRVLFPIIKRVMPNLFANKLVSVQPVDARTGVIYYLDYKYASNKNGNGPAAANGGIYSGANLDLDNEGGALAGGIPSLYSSHKFGPFIGTVDGSGGLTIELTTSSDNQVLQFFADNGLISGVDDTTGFISKYVGFAHKGFDSAGVRTNGKGFTAYYMGSRVPALEANLVFSEGATAGSNLAITTSANVSSLANKKVMVFWHYEQESTEYMPEMEFNVSSETVETAERKLKIKWTKESEQDMQRYHKIDVESELVKIASMEQNYETDRELIDFIENVVPAALDKVHVFGDDPTVINPSTPTGVVAANGIGAVQGTQGNFLDKHRLLAQKMFEQGALMAQYNRLGVANWGVVGPQMGALIKQLPGFEGDLFSNNNLKIQELGELSNGSLTIYSDINRPQARKDEILMGYKSNVSEYGAGVVYSPYTQWMSDVVTNPNNFDSIRGFFSRYGITKVRRGQWYYSRLKVVNTGMY